jgi:hypothetical protein
LEKIAHPGTESDREFRRSSALASAVPGVELVHLCEVLSDCEPAEFGHVIHLQPVFRGEPSVELEATWAEICYGGCVVLHGVLEVPPGRLFRPVAETAKGQDIPTTKSVLAIVLAADSRDSDDLE